MMNFESMSEKEVSDIANPIMDSLMDASSQIDHEKHVQDFTDRLKSIVTKEHLQEICKEYQKEKGFFSERDQLSVLRRPDSAIITWKQKFTKVSGEYLAEMVLVNKNGKFLVDHTWVI
jgi:hypothetical protein